MKKLIEQKKNDLLSYLNREILPFIEPEENLFRECIVFIIEDSLLFISSEKTTEISQEKIQKVTETLLKLESIFFNKEFIEDFSVFSQEYSLLVYNWNDNLVKLKNLENQATIITRLYSMRMTMEQLIIMGRKLLQINNYQNQYTIPTIELSKNYLATLIEGNKNE